MRYDFETFTITRKVEDGIINLTGIAKSFVKRKDVPRRMYLSINIDEYEKAGESTKEAESCFIWECQSCWS